MIKKWVWLILLSLFFLSPVQALEKNELTVSAAMSLKDVFIVLGKSFEQEFPGVKILFNFAGSGHLRAQIEGGAPVDVFASAAVADVDILESKNLIEKETVVVLTHNKLALIEPYVSKFNLKSIKDLTKKDIVKIAVGNPSTVPAGQYAKEALVYFKIFDDVKSKLIFGENVKQVLDYVVRGEVDAGFVFSSDLKSKNEVRFVEEISGESHRPIIYPIAVVKSSKHFDLAKEFIKFVTSKKAQEQFKIYGYN